MQRRSFSREFKVEAVKLVRERGVSAAQAARDLDVHENVLRKWVKEFGSDPAHSFPGHGQMKPEQLEIERKRCFQATALRSCFRYAHGSSSSISRLG
jgi:transposase